jgi:hypothetical protein
MVLPESLPPDAGLFAAGSNLLVRAPLQSVPTAVRRAAQQAGAAPAGDAAAAAPPAGDQESAAAADADDSGLVSTAPGGLGETVEFETELFVGRMKVGGGGGGEKEALHTVQ